jgi:PAS domain S-box-containing protein
LGELNDRDRRGGAALLAERQQDELTRARLAAIVTSCPDPIIGESLDGIITDWNPAAERLYGYAADEAIGQPLAIICPPDRRDEVATLLARVRHGESIEAFETVRQAKDGRLIDVSLTIFPIRNDRGELIGASATTRDITARKLAEAALSAAQQQTQDMLEQVGRLSQELRASEAKYRALVEHLPAVVYLTAADERETPLYYSPYIEVLQGITFEDVLERSTHETWLDYVHPEDLERVIELDRRASEEGSPFRAEYRTRRSDGSYVWIREEGAPLRNEDGEIVAWQGVLLDISDRIEAEAAQARLAAIVESAEDAIISFDLDGVITSWNQGAQRLYGYHAEEMIGQPLTVLLPHAEAESSIARLDELDDQPIRYEATRRRADGALIEVAVSLSPIRDPGGRITGGSSIGRDITERKRGEAVLREALDEARAATQAKAQFMAILSHELRTPLQAVLGYAEFLLNDPTATLTAEQREDVGYIHQGARRMVGLIEQILDLSRMEAGRLELKIADVNLGTVIEQVRQDIAPQVEAKGLTLVVDVPAGLPPVRADADRLRQILLNLAGNAAKFTETGSVTIAAAPAPEGGVDVSVSDTGIGIPPEALSRIFEEFQQVDTPLTRKHRGAGLGLAIARGLAELMGGRIAVTSTPGEGSTFTLHLDGGRRTEDGSRMSVAASEAGGAFLRSAVSGGSSLVRQ